MQEVCWWLLSHWLRRVRWLDVLFTDLLWISSRFIMTLNTFRTYCCCCCCCWLLSLFPVFCHFCCSVCHFQLYKGVCFIFIASVSSHEPHCLIQMNQMTSPARRSVPRWSVGLGSLYTSPFALGSAGWPGCSAEEYSWLFSTKLFSRWSVSVEQSQSVPGN